MPLRKVTINGHACQAINIGTGSENKVIQVNILRKPTLVLGPGQQLNHYLTKVLSQTRFLLAYTGELALAGGWRINDLATPS
jgi:hypothetical protein